MTYYRNFDILRLAAAASVVFSHSFLIATGSEETEPLMGTGLVAGVYGVFVFFILSGFLVTGSAKRSAGIEVFLRNRFLRIAPALTVSTLIIAYLLCPPFASIDANAFILDPAVFQRVVEVITFHSADFLFETVSFYPPRSESDWLPHIANGVLWSIRIEVFCYGVIALMASLALFRQKRQALLLAVLALGTGFSLYFLKAVTTLWVSQLLLLLPSLFCGVFMTWLVQWHRPKGAIAALCLAATIPAIYFGILPRVFCFCIAYPLIWIGASQVKLVPTFYEGTDISYGLYLYGWPVTQLIRHYVGPDLNGYEMTALALPATMLVAWLSWVLVEAPALRLKRYRPTPQVAP